MLTLSRGRPETMSFMQPTGRIILKVPAEATRSSRARPGRAETSSMEVRTPTSLPMRPARRAMA